MILDKLLEKKDLGAYIAFRIKRLESTRIDAMKNAKDRKKQVISERFIGRMLELQELRNVLEQDTLKERSKDYAKDVKKEETKAEILRRIMEAIQEVNDDLEARREAEKNQRTYSMLSEEQLKRIYRQGI